MELQRQPLSRDLDDGWDGYDGWDGSSGWYGMDVIDMMDVRMGGCVDG